MKPPLVTWKETSRAYQKALGLYTQELGIECYPWNDDTPRKYWGDCRPLYAGDLEGLKIKLKKIKPSTKSGVLSCVVEDSESNPTFLLFRYEP